MKEITRSFDEAFYGAWSLFPGGCPLPSPVPYFTLGKVVYEPVKPREGACVSAHLITDAFYIMTLPSPKDKDARVKVSGFAHRGENCELITRC